MLRVFLPAYWKLALAWARGEDIFLLSAGVTVLVVAFWQRREYRALLVFSLAIAVSLAPALPLTISLSTTETERVVYIPTACGALHSVLVVQALLVENAGGLAGPTVTGCVRITADSSDYGAVAKRTFNPRRVGAR